MNYSEAIDFLYSQKSLGIRQGLEVFQILLERLNNPHGQFKSVLIAGTNGKGSTAAILQSILIESGYNTGLYTSPHLLDFKERIKVNRDTIREEDLVEAVEKIKSVSHDIQPTFFEYATAIAFLHFSKIGVDMAILETGMGGRWDATNVVRPEVSLITPIDLDHTDYLGNSPEQIAMEKGEIVKEGGCLITAPQNKKVMEVLKKNCADRNATLTAISRNFDTEIFFMNLTGSIFDFHCNNHMLEKIKIPLAGGYQVKNATLSIASALHLQAKGFSGISGKSILKGAERTVWRGRMETVSVAPKLVLDVAHNPSAIQTLVSELRELFEFSTLVFILGIMKDKNIPLIINELIKISDLTLAVKLDSDRAEDPENIVRFFKERGKDALVVNHIKEALLEAKKRAGRDGLVCVTGSFITVSEACNALKIKV